MAHDEDSARDRAAILARRRRFVALALTGLATAACKAPQPCLSMPVPEDEGVEIGEDEDGDGAEADSNGPFVEDEGQPVQSTDPEGEGDSGDEPPKDGPRPEVCLNIAPVRLKQTAPQPCLDMPAQPVRPKKSQPHPCLLMIDVD